MKDPNFTIAYCNDRLTTVKITKTKHDEYRVAFRNDSFAETSAYYTSDLADAFNTGLKMEPHGLYRQQGRK